MTSSSPQREQYRSAHRAMLARAPVGVDDDALLGIEHSQAVRTREAVDEIVYVVRSRPDAAHDDGPVGNVVRNAPRTVLVVVEAVLWDVVDLRMERAELVVERA